MAVRQTSIAGRFFPEDHEELDALLAEFDQAVAGSGGAAPARAIVSPHAGYRFSGALAAAAWAATEGACPDRIAILSPPHHLAFDGIAVPTAHKAVAIPKRRIRIDDRACQALIRSGLAHGLEAAFAQEHGIDTQLPFARHRHPGVPVVPIVIGRATAGQVAHAIDRLAKMQGETLFVLSSDLGHFLPRDQAQRIDGQTAGLLETGQGARLTPSHACGARALSGWLTSQSGAGARVLRLGMRSSHDTTGDGARVVGYGAWAFFDAERDILTAAHRQELLRTARAALASRLAHGRAPELALDSYPVPLRTLMASFVTLELDGRLRGCVGSVAPHRPLIVDVAANAIKAGFEDPRFPALTAEELARVALKLSVLSHPAPVRFDSEEALIEALVPGESGVILSEGERRGLFLPSVWASIPDPREFLCALRRKAGLEKDHWRPTQEIRLFRAEAFDSAKAAAAAA